MPAPIKPPSSLLFIFVWAWGRTSMEGAFSSPKNGYILNPDPVGSVCHNHVSHIGWLASQYSTCIPVLNLHGSFYKASAPTNPWSLLLCVLGIRDPRIAASAHQVNGSWFRFAKQVCKCNFPWRESTAKRWVKTLHKGILHKAQYDCRQQYEESSKAGWLSCPEGSSVTFVLQSAGPGDIHRLFVPRNWCDTSASHQQFLCRCSQNENTCRSLKSTWIFRRSVKEA